MSEWNHNTQHHSRVLRQLPPNPGRVLDIGCGDGSFAAVVAQRAAHVDAIDIDRGEVTKARERCAHLTNVSVSQADVLTAELPYEAYDVVTALASLHHLPFDQAVARFTDLLRPGGRLVVLDVWTDRSLKDVPWNLASTALNLVLKAIHGPDHMGSPTAHTHTSLGQVRAASAVQLPGSVLRRHLLWRYTIVWDKPLP